MTYTRNVDVGPVGAVDVELELAVAVDAVSGPDSEVMEVLAE